MKSSKSSLFPPPFLPSYFSSVFLNRKNSVFSSALPYFDKNFVYVKNVFKEITKKNKKTTKNNICILFDGLQNTSPQRYMYSTATFFSSFIPSSPSFSKSFLKNSNLFFIFFRYFSTNQKNAGNLKGKKEEMLNILWPSVVRKNYENEIKKVFLNNDDNYRNVWLLGTKGSGKTSLIFRAQKNFEEKKNAVQSFKPIVLLFDFAEVEYRNFQICIWRLEESLRSQFLCLAGNCIACEWVFDKMRLKFDDFLNQLKYFLFDIQNAGSAAAFHVPPPTCSSIKKFIQLIDEGLFNEESWKSLMHFFLKIPSLKSLVQPANTTNMSMHIVKCMGECEESRHAYKQSGGLMRVYPTGIKIMAHFLCLLDEFRKEKKVPVSIVFENVHILGRSVYLLDRGGMFIECYMALVLQKFFVPTICVTSDSLFAIKSIFLNASIKQENDEEKKNAAKNMFNEKQNKESKKNNNRGGEIEGIGSSLNDVSLNIHSLIPPPSVKIIQIDDWPYKLTKEVLYPKFTEYEEIFEGIWAAFGGNCRHLEKVAKALVSAKYQHEMEKKKPKLHEEGNKVDDMDEAQLPADASDEQKLNFEKLEFQKNFLRNLPQNLLTQEMRQFEWQMNRFMSLQTIEQMKLEQNNIVHFYVTILETFRYILSKPHILCTNFLAITNPIVLGLIDIGVLTVKLNPCRLEVSSVFTKHLLNNFIYLKYGSLPWKDRVYYNMNFLLNYKAIRKQINLLSEI